MKLTNKNISNLSINDLIGKKLNCECGNMHSMTTKYVVVEEDAINKLPQIIEELGYKSILTISDTNTNKVAGNKVNESLAKSKLNIKNLVFETSGKDLVPNEEAVGKILVNAPKGLEVIIAIGTGTLNDLAKFVAYKLGIPSIVVATAPSMDGFASNGAALIIGNLKISYITDCPEVIIGDVNIFKDAPMDMITAGFADIVGKYSALCDWRLSQLINKEYFCQVSYNMVENSLKKCIENTLGIKNRDKIAIKNLMDALVLTGIAMSYVGNSRPASGSEHHMSHYFEMMFQFEGKQPVLHGAKVGISTVITMQLRELLAKATINFDEAIVKAENFDQDKWKENVKEHYLSAAKGIIDVNEKEQRNSIEKREERIKFTKENLDKILEIIEDVPSAEEIKEILKSVGAPYTPNQVGIDEKMLLDCIKMAKEVRTRYSILNLLSDIGVLDDFAILARVDIEKENE
ncbi:sn-glycerol-1-phosphate dehydrogenase [Clostridium lacusfryxellense]|uniref:sn-glycerol-1-phosphate dehydrogenase n=1 Tax=Clostridium lacusfryxellense TaxID=205328 RepID=UPI001C0AE455|nr:sn-glycerol-1-phosphate dehydrogenase [Clostridium lacusfryxellense]MBU3110004.1 sn-glycerol-1-phosphate dehydrogenase [Clostridium lacusfryxellense]